MEVFKIFYLKKYVVQCSEFEKKKETKCKTLKKNSIVKSIIRTFVGIL